MDEFPDELAWLAKLDGSVVTGFGPFQESPEPPERGVAFYVQDFALQRPAPWKIPSRVLRETSQEFENRTEQQGLPFQIGWCSPEAGPFSRVFQEVAGSIHSGLFEKTVPVVTECGRATSTPGPAILAATARQRTPLQAYGWIQHDSGFAGATPEILFSLRGSHLETMALAGTARSDDQEVFAADQKEIREHEYVAQALVSKLFDLGQVRAGPRQILELGSIIHFLTSIEVELHQQLSPGELIRRLHPTPALGPLPRQPRTMEMLLEWRRQLDCPPEFGAPFGLWDEGKFHAVVAIRGLWWNGPDVKLPAGCGVIEASRLVNEWRELRLKREAVKNFLIPTAGKSVR